MDWVDGQIKVMHLSETSAGAGAVAVRLRPAAEGVEWRILFATASQNDGAIFGAWFYTTPEAPGGVQMAAVTHTGVNVPLDMFAYAENQPAALPAPIYAMWDRYPSYIFLASGAGKVGTVIALVIERLGLGDLE